MFFKRSDKTIQKRIESIDGLGGMTVNERLWISNLMEEFNDAMLNNHPRARQILKWLKVDDPSIEAIIEQSSEEVIEIGIDRSGRLYITPAKQEFNLIWRSAKEVHWDSDRKYLYSPKPREWSYYHWYCHIVNIIKIEYRCKLYITSQTKWTNIPEELKLKIIDLNL